jgi:alpha-glucosidase
MLRRISSFLYIVIPLYFCCIWRIAAQDTFYLQSPDKELKLSVYSGNEINYSLQKKDALLLDKSNIALQLQNMIFGKNEKVIKSSVQSVNEPILVPIGEHKMVMNTYNELILDFEKPFSIHFRLYNNAFSYRFESRVRGEIIVENEISNYKFAENMDFYFPSDQNGESSFTIKDFFSIDQSNKVFLPFLLKSKPQQEKKLIMITEANVLDYPSMILQKSKDWLTNFNAYFQPYPTKFKAGGYLDYTPMPIETEKYIAKTSGTRKFPWRVVLVPNHESELLYNQTVYKLAEPSKSNSDWTWVKTGLCVWEFWHNLNLTGLDFKTKQNTQTYLHYLDFAAKNQIPYMIVDWKWSHVHDIKQLNPEIDIKLITSEAQKKNVQIVLWVLAHSIYNKLDQNLDFLKSLGASGIKVDFFDRDDQLSNQMYEKIAAACAQRKMVVDFHGCSKPTGLHRKYPNIINYEAVKGNETNTFSNQGLTPLHHLQVAFIRGAVGPMDFTPGSLNNVLLEDYHRSLNHPMTIGTRMHELALLLLYQAPLQMLCDAPTEYSKNTKILDLLKSLPTSFDTTVVIDSKLDEYVLVARKQKDTWYIAGIANEAMNKTISFDFLDKGSYGAEFYLDGINSEKSPTDYQTEKKEISSDSKVSLSMHKHGGLIIKISKQP